MYNNYYQSNIRGNVYSLETGSKKCINNKQIMSTRYSWGADERKPPEGHGQYLINSHRVAIDNSFTGDTRFKYPKHEAVLPDLEYALHSYTHHPDFNNEHDDLFHNAPIASQPNKEHFANLPPLIINHAGLKDKDNPRQSVLASVAERMEPLVHEQGAFTEDEKTGINYEHPVADYIDDISGTSLDKKIEKEHLPYLKYFPLEDKNIHRYLKAMLGEAHEKYNDYLSNLKNVYNREVEDRTNDAVNDYLHQHGRQDRDMNELRDEIRGEIARSIHDNRYKDIGYRTFPQFIRDHLFNNLPPPLHTLKDVLLEGLHNIHSR